MNSNSHHSEANSSGQFRTSRLPLAAYITAAKLLPLVSIDVDADTKFADFVFGDISQRGPEFETQFLSGQALVDANAFHHQLRTLRKEIDNRLNRLRRDGNGSNHGGANHHSGANRHGIPNQQ